jgi:HPt (histidine-containing phosphotransfer) domain-containing protein
LVLDYPALLARVDGDLELLRDIVELYLQDCPRQLAEVGRAITDGDAVRLRRAAHAFKGSVGNFGSGTTYEAARQLEMLGLAGEMAGAAEVFASLEKAAEGLGAALENLLPRRAKT